jgi:IPT/TIG domain
MTDTLSRPSDVTELVSVGRWQARLGPHGVQVSPAAWSPSPQARGGIRVLPEPGDALLGRQHEFGSVLEALRGGAPVNVWGEGGIGKTSLLRQVAHWAADEFSSLPVVFATAARKPLEDLLHEIHACLFETPVVTKWRPDHVREQLRTAQAVVVIDDVALEDADLADLLWTLSDSLVVIASPVMRNDPALEPVGLNGLDPGSATELFLRVLGDHRLSPGEPEEIGRLTGPELLRGHPFQVRQAAALVRSGRRTIAELARILQFGDPADRLAQECLNALSPHEREVISVLALAAGTYMPADLVAHMSPTEHVLDHLYILRDRHVIDSRWDWFGLPACSLGEPLQLIAPSLDLGFALHGLVTWLRQPEVSAEELISVTGCVLAMLQFAREAGEWDSALEIIREVEPALFICGRWEQWRSVVTVGVEAAGQLGDHGFRAYCLHQLGSRALLLGDRSQATRLLTQAASLRPRRLAHEARSVTTRNLALISSSRHWPHSITTTTAATVVLAAGGLAAVSIFFHPARSLLLLPPHSTGLPPASAPGSALPSFGSSSPGKTSRSPMPSVSPSRLVSLGPLESPAAATNSASPSATRTRPARQRQVTVVVSAVSPKSGPESGGTTVTVSGQGFTGATQVDFAGVSAPSISVVSDSKITATSPPGAGTVNVTVVTPNGASATNPADRFTYIAPVPTVTGVSPGSGPESGGTTVTISGSGFSDAIKVDFGGVSAPSFSIDSGSRITVKSPPGTGTVDIRVITPTRTSAITSADQFTYDSGQGSGGAHPR